MRPGRLRLTKRLRISLSGAVRDSRLSGRVCLSVDRREAELRLETVQKGIHGAWSRSRNDNVNASTAGTHRNVQDCLRVGTRRGEYLDFIERGVIQSTDTIEETEVVACLRMPRAIRQAITAHHLQALISRRNEAVYQDSDKVCQTTCIECRRAVAARSCEAHRVSLSPSGGRLGVSRARSTTSMRHHMIYNSLVQATRRQNCVIRYVCDGRSAAGPRRAITCKIMTEQHFRRNTERPRSRLCRSA